MSAPFVRLAANPSPQPNPPQSQLASSATTSSGALAYITFIPAIIFLLVEPFKRNRFIRFHSFQCIFLWVAGLLLGIPLRLAFFVLFLIPGLGQLIVLLTSMVLSLGCSILVIVLLVKALQGEMFKLPFIGDQAEKQANAG